MATQQLQALEQERASRIEAPFIAEMSNLFAQIRAELVRAQQTATDISQLDHRVDQQETVFNAQLTAITARLNLIQESLNERLYKIEGGDEKLRKNIENSLWNLEDLARRKASALWSQAKIKELAPVDPSPFGSLRVGYNQNDERVFVQGGLNTGSAKPGTTPSSAPIGSSSGVPGAQSPYGSGPAPGLPGAQPPYPSPYPQGGYAQQPSYPQQSQPGYGAPQPGYGAQTPPPYGASPYGAQPSAVPSYSAQPGGYPAQPGGYPQQYPGAPYY